MPRTKLHKTVEKKKAAQKIEATSVVTTDSPDVKATAPTEPNPFSIASDPMQLASEIEFPAKFAVLTERLERLGFENWLARIGADALCQAKLNGKPTNQYGYLIVKEAERRAANPKYSGAA